MDTLLAATPARPQVDALAEWKADLAADQAIAG
jgi:hypothetical protein